MKTYLKTFTSTFRRHFTRLVSIFLMVLVSVGFTAGILMARGKMVNSLSVYAKNASVSDILLRGEEPFSDETLVLLKERYGESNVETGGILELDGNVFEASMDTGMGVSIQLMAQLEGLGEGVTRVYFGSGKQNRAEVLDASPTSEEGVIPVAVQASEGGIPSLGDKLKATVSATIPFLGEQKTEYTFVVTEIVRSPLHFATMDDASMQKIEGEEEEFEPLARIFYIGDAVFPFMGQELTFPQNEVRIHVPTLEKHALFGVFYERDLKTETDWLEETFSKEIEAETMGVLTLHENYSFESFLQYAEKIEGIGFVLTVVFLLVTLLVVLSSMTRLLEEDRGQIACLRTLGYSPMQILSKYLLFAFVGVVIGGTGAYFAGEGLAYIIYINFAWNYAIPPYSPVPSPLFFILAAGLVFLATMSATLFSGLHKMKEVPAAMLRPHSPKAGRKVLLEKIPVIWNRLSFKYKSTMRNVFRFRTRFFMTVVSVMASTALVVAGLAVLDCCLFQDVGTTAMIGVAIIVLLFAALLNAVVIYTLTNVNVSERNRELATLMVLGYHDREVAWYVYREIYITSSIGIALGLPFGLLLCAFIFEVMGFGSIPLIGWYVWLVTPLLSLFFTFFVTILLRRRIVGIDMNESLKAIE